jgi:fructose-specific phosphotransferase system IIC component
MPSFSSLDLSTVNWLFVGLMAVFAFVAALLGGLIAFRSRFLGAIIAGILFAIFFVLWNTYPHPTIPLPIVATYTVPNG